MGRGRADVDAMRARAEPDPHGARGESGETGTCGCGSANVDRSVRAVRGGPEVGQRLGPPAPGHEQRVVMPPHRHTATASAHAGRGGLPPAKAPVDSHGAASTVLPPPRTLYGQADGGGEVRLSELVGAMSCALDLTEGQPRGHAARTCLIGMRIATELRLPARERSDLYYALLLKDAGCSSNAAATVDFFGSDDHAVKRNLKTVDWQRGLHATLYGIRNAAVGRGFRARVRQLLRMRGRAGAGTELIRIRCERGAEIVRKMGFPEASAAAVRALDEHWNGGGSPDGIAGEAIPLAARIASLAQTVEVFAAERGWREAMAMARARQGRWFDPELVRVLDTFREAGWWEALYRGNPIEGLPALEPDDRVLTVDAGGVDRVAEAFAEVVDAKSPFTFRHSQRVAELARALAERLGASAGMVRCVYRAGLLHDIGKLGVSNRILDKAGPLTPAERLQVERHPLMTWTILERVQVFAPIARLASVHHERLDGAGYPWRIAAPALDRLERALAVCDIYEALTADRPYRAGLEPGQALGLLTEMRGTAVDGELVEAMQDMVR
jgi:HD-GYP domain-containing protein (c-di-GMP phosphodiesterase class II)